MFLGLYYGGLRRSTEVGLLLLFGHFDRFDKLSDRSDRCVRSDRLFQRLSLSKPPENTL